MAEKHLLITGRVASGKTEALIGIANLHSKKTLFLSEECNEQELKEKRGLSNEVKVIDTNSFNISELTNYETLCIDYLELLDNKFIEELIEIIKTNSIRIILTSQVRRGDYELILRIKHLITRRS